MGDWSPWVLDFASNSPGGIIDPERIAIFSWEYKVPAFGSKINITYEDALKIKEIIDTKKAPITGVMIGNDRFTPLLPLEDVSFLFKLGKISALAYNGEKYLVFVCAKENQSINAVTNYIFSVAGQLNPPRS